MEDPNYCVVKFSVGPEIGAIVEALKAFQVRLSGCCICYDVSRNSVMIIKIFKEGYEVG